MNNDFPPVPTTYCRDPSKYWDALINALKLQNMPYYFSREAIVIPYINCMLSFSVHEGFFGSHLTTSDRLSYKINDKVTLSEYASSIILERKKEYLEEVQRYHPIK
jgi:hypothetical protein